MPGSYDWLGRKTSMTDPDMGSWSYTYDLNSNLQTQTDAKGQTITFSYDNLNRLTGKTYPQGSGMTNVGYTYDSIANGNYGKGMRTGMTDASGSTAYKYDTRGRLTEEKRTVSQVDYVTQYTYDSADRPATITYPTGEVVTQTYDGRSSLPETLIGSIAGTLVGLTKYNQLGQIKNISLGNGANTTFNYYGLDAGAPANYYGRLWQINTTASTTLQDVRYTWDANGNMIQRQNITAGETENFGYDFLDRLTSVSGAYSQSYAYNQIGNITSMNGVSYTYGTKPHAVTAVGNTNYIYDANGSMIARGSQSITWNVDNMPVTIGSSTFVYDGDGNRVKKTENGQTILYVNRYYEKNLTTGEVTTHYYLGDKEIAFRKGTTLEYVHQDSLGSTSVTTNSSGTVVDTVSFYPFGDRWESTDPLDTDKLFTGQRLDSSGLYFYNARYYDATIGRFISADSIVPDWTNPQSYNRYSYVLNNPLRYTDPSGNWPKWANPCNWNWGGTADMFKGYGDAVVGTGKGLWQLASSNPVGTAKNLYNAASNPGDTWNAIYNEYSTLAQSDRGRGKIVGEILITAATITAGFATKAGKVAETVSIVEEAGSSGGMGFRSFSALKQAMGSPGEGKVWHHIVEQSQITRFGAEAIHNTSNVAAVTTGTNIRLNALYSSIRVNITGSSTLTVRQWLSTQSFEQASSFGRMAIENVSKGIWP